jgi:hypothetical protein
MCLRLTRKSLRLTMRLTEAEQKLLAEEWDRQMWLRLTPEETRILKSALLRSARVVHPGEHATAETGKPTTPTNANT